MDNKDIKIYNAELGIDGTIPQLIDWAYRYDSDYSDEALDEIARQAIALGFVEEAKIPILVKESRNRGDYTLPYEDMKLDKLTGGKISYESTEEYGEVEIREENDLVLVSISTSDGCAASSCTVHEFMNGEEDFLEIFIGNTLFYNYVPYDED